MMDEAVATRNPYKDRKGGFVRFEDVGAYRKFMTSGKLEILVVIMSKRPQSIYELAKITSRSFSNVLKDCQGLAHTGFIQLIDVGDQRETKKPELAFDYERIVIEMPNLGSYEIHLKAA